MTQVKEKNEILTPALFSDIFDSAKFFGKNWFEKEFGQNLPAVNINETSKHFNLEFAAPGFTKDDFKVSVDGNVLTISAEKKEEKSEKNKKFTRKEFSFNSFTRSFRLPELVIADKIDAKYTNGILNLSIPKKEETKSLPKKDIKVS
jgi:HSP20 family protein